MAAIERLGVPTVDLWGQPWAATLPRAGCDEPAVARLAAEHLFERGFSRFAFVGVAGMGWSAARGAAFARLVEERGGTCDRFEFRRSLLAGPPPPSHLARLRDWLLRLPRPLGVMAVNDFHAAVVATACGAAGLAVPEQVAIIGVDDDLPICELATPPLSSVVVDHQGVGRAAARLLERLMAGEPIDPGPVSVPPVGVVTRQSTACLAVEDSLVAAALTLIRGAAPGRLVIADLAGELNCSRAWLTRAFRVHVGHGIHEEILRVRLQEARRLLDETDLTLDAVAHRTGFEHPETLGRVFRRKLGLSPGAYRRQQGNRPRPAGGGGVYLSLCGWVLRVLTRLVEAFGSSVDSETFHHNQPPSVCPPGSRGSSKRTFRGRHLHAGDGRALGGPGRQRPDHAPAQRRQWNQHVLVGCEHDRRPYDQSDFRGGVSGDRRRWSRW